MLNLVFCFFWKEVSKIRDFKCYNLYFSGFLDVKYWDWIYKVKIWFFNINVFKSGFWKLLFFNESLELRC